MKRIPLSKGAFALVDDSDFEKLSQHSWWLNSSGYAARTIWFGRDKKPKHKNVAMHREIMGLTDPEVLVDHVNGVRTDNRRSNLRLSDKSTNGCNRPRTRVNTSGFKGVTKHNQCNRWISQIRVHNKNHYLGLFETPEEAALAYNNAATSHFGDRAYLNAL